MRRMQQRPEYVLPGLLRYDVACGRGTGTYHVGNKRLHRIVQEFAAAYMALDDGERYHLADKIVALVQQLHGGETQHGGDAGGHFYERDVGGEWREVTAFRAREKCQTLLRDYAFKLRRRRTPPKHELESTPGTPRYEPPVVAVSAAVVTPPQESSPGVISAWPGPAPSLPFAPLLPSFSSSSAVTVAGGELLSSHTTAGGWTSSVPPKDGEVVVVVNEDDAAMIAAFLRDIGIIDLPLSFSSSSLDNGNGQELATTAAAAAASSTPAPLDDPLWSAMDYLDEPEFAALL